MELMQKFRFVNEVGGLHSSTGGAWRHARKGHNRPLCQNRSHAGALVLEGCKDRFRTQQ